MVVLLEHRLVDGKDHFVESKTAAQLVFRKETLKAALLVCILERK